MNTEYMAMAIFSWNRALAITGKKSGAAMQRRARIYPIFIAIIFCVALPAQAASLQSCARKNALVELFSAEGSNAAVLVADLDENPRNIIVTRAAPAKGKADRLGEYVRKNVQWVTDQRPQIVIGGQVGFALSDAERIRESLAATHNEIGIAMNISGATAATEGDGGENELRFLALASGNDSGANLVVAEQALPCGRKGCTAELPAKLRKAKDANRWLAVLQSTATGRVLAAEWLSPDKAR